MVEVGAYYQHDRPELVEQVDIGARRVLDIGCGAGKVAAAIKLQRQAAEIWGIEVVPEVAGAARQSPALDHVLTGDIAALLDDLPEGGFSHIVAGDVLEHLADPWAVLQRLHDCLEPGGKFICSIPNIRNLSFALKLFIRGRFEYSDSGVLDRTHLRFFARRDIELMFGNAGFSDIDIRPARPKRGLIKQAGRLLLGDLVIKVFLVTARSAR